MMVCNGKWEMIFCFYEKDLAFKVAKQYTYLYPLQVRDDLNKNNRRRGVLKTFVDWKCRPGKCKK